MESELARMRALQAGYQRTYRQKHREKLGRYFKEWVRKNPEKLRARRAVQAETESGRMERPARCSSCRRKSWVYAHHEDYDKILEIIWLCSACHRKAHGR